MPNDVRFLPTQDRWIVITRLVSVRNPLFIIVDVAHWLEVYPIVKRRDDLNQHIKYKENRILIYKGCQWYFIADTDLNNFYVIMVRHLASDVERCVCFLATTTSVSVFSNIKHQTSNVKHHDQIIQICNL